MCHIKAFNLILVVAIFHLSSCATSSINPELPEIFPDTAPSNICYLRTVREVRILGKRMQFNATGTLIEKRYLVTAAHNVYDSWRTKLVEVQVFCKSDDHELKSSVVTKDAIGLARKVGHYNKRFQTDYAFFRLNEILPIRESFAFNRNIEIGSIGNINVAGFPGGQYKYGEGKLIQPIPNDATFYYDVETAKGMSGGPVWVRSDGGNLLIGIHVSSGRARAIDKDLIDDFDKWKRSFVQ